MFAPKVAETETKGGANLSRKLAPWTPRPAGAARNADRNQGALPADLTARAAKRGIAWDFGKIPLFPPDRASQSQAAPGIIQPKLVVGRIDDPLEHEADRVADQVMRMTVLDVSGTSAPVRLSRKCNACEEEERLSRAPLHGHAPETSGIESPALVHEVLRSPGEALDGATRAFFEPRLGYDLSTVRVHRDARAAASARSVAALAYTVGNHVVFSENQYRPDTPSGQRLLSHELTHTIQQSAVALSRAPVQSAAASDIAVRRAVGPLLQRQVACSLGHLDKECGNAAAQCAGIQDAYCKDKYPKPGDIAQLHQKAVDSANTYKSKYPNASANLLHFLDGAGTERVMPINIFKNHSATKEKLENEHRDKFIDGGKRRLASGVLKPGAGQVEMVWTGTASAFDISNFDDLGLAVGGYTLCSKVKVSAIDKGSGAVTMSFDDWQVQAFDCYNWDPGKGIGIPGVDDNDFCCLENAKRAMHYRVRSDPWKNDDAAAASPADLAGSSSSSDGGKSSKR